LRDASEDATMELYTAGTGNGQRAAIAVNECGVTCKIHVLNLAQGDQKKPDYLKINPTGRIPTLIDPQGPDGKPLTLIQSWAILIYLAEKTGKLRAHNTVARARTFQWVAEGASDMAPTAQNIFFLGSRMPEKVPDSAVKFYEDRLVNLFRAADQQLAVSPYLTGEEVTIADIGIYPIYAGRKALIDGAGLKNVTGWGERVGSRPGVQKGMKLES
jgi:GST-like protein